MTKKKIKKELPSDDLRSRFTRRLLLINTALESRGVEKLTEEEETYLATMLYNASKLYSNRLGCNKKVALDTINTLPLFTFAGNKELKNYMEDILKYMKEQVEI